jgi:hypothetical protein
MFEFLKSKTFDAVFSFVLGLGLMALLKPGCKEGECHIQKAPPYEEVKSSTYQLGSKCYKFEAEPVECPMTGVIEPFERFVR